MDWIDRFANFGIAGAMLGGVSFALWRSLQWVGVEIIKPARDRFFSRFDAFLGRMEGAVERVEKAIDMVAEKQSIMAARLDSQQYLCKSHLAEVQQLGIKKAEEGKK